MVVVNLSTLRNIYLMPGSMILLVHMFLGTCLFSPNLSLLLTVVRFWSIRITTSY